MAPEDKHDEQTPQAESARRLPPEEHIHRLNEENARRRKENEALKARLALLERAARRRAVEMARRDALAALVRAAQDSGKSVDVEKLSAFLEKGMLALDIDLEADVEVKADGSAELRKEALERLEAAVGSAVELAARETTVVGPPRPSAEPPANRGKAEGPPPGFANAWDTPQAVSLADRGRKELRDAATTDEDVQDAIGRL